MDQITDYNVCALPFRVTHVEGLSTVSLATAMKVKFIKNSVIISRLYKKAVFLVKHSSFSGHCEHLWLTSYCYLAFITFTNSGLTLENSMELSLFMDEVLTWHRAMVKAQKKMG